MVLRLGGGQPNVNIKTNSVIYNVAGWTKLSSVICRIDHT